MNPESVTILLTIAVVLSGVALSVGAVAIVGVYRTIRRLEAELMPLFPVAMSTLDQAHQTLALSLTQIEQLSAKAHVVLDSSKQQLDAFSEARGELTQRFRAQAERLELVLDDTLSRVHDVVGVVHKGVVTPVREVAGVLSGIRTAFQAFVGNRRPSVERATHDEEMFI